MNTPIIIVNNEEIKSLLIQHGKSAHLEPRPGLPAQFRLHIAWADARKYYAVTRYCGYDNEVDNGYTALIIPRHVMDAKTASTVIRCFLDSGRDKTGRGFTEVVEENVGVN